MGFLPRLLLAGLAGGIAAGGLTFFFMSVMRTEPPEFLIIVSGPLAGLAVMHFLRPKSDAPQVEDEEDDAPRQFVGKACVVCDEKVRAQPDATSCDECDAVLHVACASEHSC